MPHSYVYEFQASMNEHSNAEYVAFPPLVVELEHHRRRDGDARGRLTAWRRPTGAGADPRDDEWARVGGEWGEYDELKAQLDGFTTEDDVRAFF